ncbi:ABC transporter permease [Halalkalibacter lacteus]|uniref:ABC transporter permease n=1 Tax=Halalkalibacter lacteus TaxID=3090663 RepID=UPI002FC98FE8
MSLFKVTDVTLELKSLPNLLDRQYARYTLRIVTILGFLIAWDLLVKINLMWPLQFGNMPSPISVLQTWSTLLTAQDGGRYYNDILMSLTRVFIGISLGFLTAVPLGIWIGLSKRATDTAFTIFEVFRPVPLIAYLPVAMLLFPTIEGGIIFITYIGAFFPILISVRDATLRMSPNLINAAKILGCKNSSVFWKVYIPSMAPEIFTGLVVGVGASWMGVITAEIMSGKHGIGYFSWTSYNLLKYESSFIGMFTIGALGFGSTAFVRFIERSVIRWKKA